MVFQNKSLVPTMELDYETPEYLLLVNTSTLIWVITYNGNTRMTLAPAKYCVIEVKLNQTVLIEKLLLVNSQQQLTKYAYLNYDNQEIDQETDTIFPRLVKVGDNENRIAGLGKNYVQDTLGLDIEYMSWGFTIDQPGDATIEQMTATSNKRTRRNY